MARPELRRQGSTEPEEADQGRGPLAPTLLLQGGPSRQCPPPCHPFSLTKQPAWRGSLLPGGVGCVCGSAPSPGSVKADMPLCTSGVINVHGRKAICLCPLFLHPRSQHLPVSHRMGHVLSSNLVISGKDHKAGQKGKAAGKEEGQTQRRTFWRSLIQKPEWTWRHITATTNVQYF